MTGTIINGNYKVINKNPTAYLDTMRYYKESDWNIEATIQYYNENWADLAPVGNDTLRRMLRDFRGELLTKIKGELMEYLSEDILGSVTTRKAQNLSYKCLQRLEFYVDKKGDEVEPSVLMDIIRASKTHQETAIRQQALDERQTAKLEHDRVTGKKSVGLTAKDLYDLSKGDVNPKLQHKVVDEAVGEVFDGNDVENVGD